MTSRYCFIISVILTAKILLAACSQPAILITITANPTTTVPTTTLTATPSPTYTLFTTPTTPPTPTPTFIPTPAGTSVPLGVFALEWYLPLIVSYDPALWEDKSDYASIDKSERLISNYLQATKLDSCKIFVQGPTDFNGPEAHKMVQLGTLKYDVISFEDRSAFYIENQSLAGFSYEVGLPILVINSNASEWKQCKEIGERVLSTLRMPSFASAPAFTPTIEPTLPPDLYPSPSPFITPVNGLSTSGCPNLEGIETKNQLTLDNAFQIMQALNSGQSDVMHRVSDPTFWDYFYLPTNGTPTPIEKDWLKVKPADQSEYSVLINAGCGKDILDISWEVVNCGSSCQTAQSPALFSHYFLINRKGTWLIWASYP